MKNSILGIVFSFIAFAGGGVTALAHEGATGLTHDAPDTDVSMVTVADEENMKKLLMHAKTHVESNTLIAEALAFQAEAVEAGGTWQNSSQTIYLIILTEGGQVLMHSRYPGIAKNVGSLRDIKDDKGDFIVRSLISGAGEADGTCVTYNYGEETRVSCAVKFTSQLQDGQEQILIVGLDHDEKSATYDAPCPTAMVDVEAADVVDKDTARQFVKGFIKELERLRAEGYNSEAMTNLRHCWREAPWKAGSIYIFAMIGDPNRTVWFNGLNWELEDQGLNVVDIKGLNVGEAIVEVAGEHQKGGFVEYHWDNPLVDGDEVSEPGKAPGTSPKISYVEGVVLPGGKTPFIIGSGIYPETDSGDGDDGCAIAGTGSSGTSKGFAFNLLLVASTLFLAASLSRRHPAGK